MILDFVRRHIGTIAVALVAAAVTAAAPAVGHGVEHALFAHDADKVDGRHAVGSGATVDARKGKLVATNPTTGRLPNNIIAKAPDADTLDGVDSTSFVRGTGDKAPDADALDSIDSTGFTRGNGTVVRGARAITPGTVGAQFVLGYSFLESAPSPHVGVYYLCPGNLANNGTVVIRNDGGDTVNLFSDNGGANPNDFRELSAGGQFDQGASPTGEHITFQVQGAGMATIEVFSIHRATDCHVQGQAVFSY